MEGPNLEQPKKTFEIKKKFQIKRHFEIKKPEQGSDSPAKERSEIQGQEQWLRQQNANDCGPCMIHNVARAFGLSLDATVESIRNHVNTMRQERGQVVLPPEGRLLSGDVGRYFAEVLRLNVEEYPCVMYEPEEVLRKIHESIDAGGVILIYSTLGEHYRAIVSDESGNPVLLDSLLNGPQAIEEGQVESIIHNTVYGSTEERMEKIGLVRHGDPAYRLIM